VPLQARNRNWCTHITVVCWTQRAIQIRSSQCTNTKKPVQVFPCKDDEERNPNNQLKKLRRPTALLTATDSSPIREFKIIFLCLRIFSYLWNKSRINCFL